MLTRVIADAEGKEREALESALQLLLLWIRQSRGMDNLNREKDSLCTVVSVVLLYNSNCPAAGELYAKRCNK